jgi:hypothetical protein
MGAQVLYDSATEATAVTPVDFLNASGVTTDPVTITCVVTDPTGVITNYNYGGSPPNNIITRTSAGNYSLTVTGITVPGLYMFVWVGSGNGVQQITPGTFRLIPLTDVGYGMQYWYTGMEELKSRLGLLPGDKNYNSFNYEMQLAIHCVANWINGYAGRHFYQLQEARTYFPESIEETGIDDLAPSMAANTLVNLDYDGDGIFETAWGKPASPLGTGTFYQLKTGRPSNPADNWNPNARGGVAWPYNQLQAILYPGTAAPGGQWLPFVWPYSHLNRVQVIGTWGWDYIPPEVQQASLMLCTDIYKSREAPWGLAGTAETGLVRIQSNPWVVELLRRYVNPKRKWGC